MGRWSLDRLTGRFSPLNTASNFGHNFCANYLLKYTTDAFGRFSEPPTLDWHEKVIKADHTASQWHEYEFNMYTLKPQSKTLEVWGRRYIEAYLAAAGQPSHGIKGSSRLLDKTGQPVPIKKLGAGLTDSGKQADAVRGYLKANGGMLNIEIHDVPSISLPLLPNEHTERLLIFNVGVEGGTMRLQAEQYLLVNAYTAPDTWTQEFALTWRRSWDSRGLRKVNPPANLVTPMAPVFRSGECW